MCIFGVCVKNWYQALKITNQQQTVPSEKWIKQTLRIFTITLGFHIQFAPKKRVQFFCGQVEMNSHPRARKLEKTQLW